MIKLLRSRRGETLVEVLIAVFISVLAAAMLATMIVAAVNINRRANLSRADFNAQLSAAEGGASPSRKTVVVDGAEIEVDFYSDGIDNALYAYARGDES